MVDKTKQTDPGKLTAYERWELPNIGTKAPDRKLANSSSQKLRPPTAQDIEKIRQQAYESGFEEGRKAGSEKGYSEGLANGKDEGFQQGLNQGLEAGKTQINEQLTHLGGFISELSQPLEKQQQLVEEAVLNISMAVARSVIHRELSLDSSSIHTAIHHLMADLPKVDNGFTLVIHPDDEPYIQPLLTQYDSALSLKLDASLTPGGCQLISSSQLIDYTIEKRFQKTVQSMLAEAVKNTSQDASVEVPSSIATLSDYPSDILKEGSPEDTELNQAESIGESGSSQEDGSVEAEAPAQLGDSELIKPDPDASGLGISEEGVPEEGLSELSSSDEGSADDVFAKDDSDKNVSAKEISPDE